jgi:hypothetical protein
MAEISSDDEKFKAAKFYLHTATALETITAARDVWISTRIQGLFSYFFLVLPPTLPPRIISKQSSRSRKASVIMMCGEVVCRLKLNNSLNL